MRDLFSIPNLITSARLVLVPVTLGAILREQFEAALWLFAAAGVSDFLDGLLARLCNWKTKLGAWMDPLADKLLMSVSYLALAAVGKLPWWLVALVLGRDLLILGMVGYALLATPLRDFPPSIWGKLSTFSQLTTAGLALADAAWTGVGLGPVVTAMVWATALTTLLSGVHYTWSGLARLIR